MKRVLVFRTGSLGDTLVSLPALKAVRDHFSDANITLLFDQQIGGGFVTPTKLLDGAGLYDDAFSYTSGQGSSLRKWMGWFVLTVKLLVRRFDVIVYLQPSKRSKAIRERDYKYFSRIGISRLIGFKYFVEPPQPIIGQSYPPSAPEAALILDRLIPEGIRPPVGNAMQWLNLTLAETQKVETWLASQGSDGGRHWLGLAIGANTSVRRWPVDRYRQVVARLIGEFDIWPVCFGGPRELPIYQALVAEWGRGHIAVGQLNLRCELVAMQRTMLFLSNNSGAIHMAAASGVPCVGVYSSSYAPKLWDPIGDHHTVLRTQIDCEGCELNECTDRGLKCLLDIDVDQVVAACRPYFARE